MKKFLKIAVLLLFFSLGYVWFFWPFPNVLPNSYAKDFCSCYFVVGLEKSLCMSASEKFLPISSLEIDEKAKRITVNGVGRTGKARLVSERKGCVLE